ncbi:MAG: dihydroneopterin aldolase [Candidatus Latescibacteria bacterium]|jgi:dihydroneopterin aldolase|nr:dihydroneopterin aldolase [Candidatus Latescibacterota bacterium]MBT5830488.1 dihydroneopterin aldolase [Candidatus Latescibacterota bacterium]
MQKDVLRIRNMTFYGYHGLLDEEATLGQQFEVDVDVFGDFRGWSRMNTHPDPVDYPRVCELVEQVVTQERFGLVEALADRIAEVLQTALNLPQLVVRVRKPNPPVPTQFDGVEVEVRRGV